MDLQQLPATEAAVRRYVEDLWLPYHRDLAAAVDRHALTGDEDVDIVEEEVEFRLDRLADETHELWVAIDRSNTALDTADVDLATTEASLAGYVTTEVEERPTVFDGPDSLVVGDIYVKAPYRGNGLARELLEHAAARADHYGCPELRLDVDVDNDRALAFYEKCGFEPYRYRMRVDVDDL